MIRRDELRCFIPSYVKLSLEICRTVPFDRFNNRSSMTVSGMEQFETDYSYDANNRLIERVKTIGDNKEVSNYSYDANGNMISRIGSVYAPQDGSRAKLKLSILGQDNPSDASDRAEAAEKG